MQFYFKLITILFPFVVLDNKDDLPPSGDLFVVDYLGRQVVTYTNASVIAKEG
jgi:hypothetical protein